MDIQQIRKANLIKLIGNVHERGAAARFAKTYNLSPDQVRNVLTDFRPMGEKLARRFEKALGLTDGSLDKPIGSDVLEEAATYAAQLQGEAAIKMLMTFRNLPPEKQLTAARLIQALDEPDNQPKKK